MHWETSKNVVYVVSLLQDESLVLFRIGIVIAWFLMSQWNFLAMQHLILCSIVRDQKAVFANSHSLKTSTPNDFPN